ncbi:MAG: response regulator [Balneola sp.]|nr:response regulator [Balneola sp.]MBO6651016.1 response regulator [Balneola sp.]
MSLLSPELIQGQSSDPIGFPFIETYQRGQFTGARQTWGITRADDGLLYFGNSRYGIQESDGLSWRNLWMERNSAALSFAKDPDGRIFVGGQADFGVLQRDSLLRRKYHSLAYLLPDSGEVIKDVEFTFVLDDQVHFISPEVWYIYSDGKITSQKNEEIISSAVRWDNTIVTLHSDGQVKRTKDGYTYSISPPDSKTKIGKLSATNDRLFMLDDGFNLWELSTSDTWTRILKLSNDISEASVTIKDFLWSQAGYIHFATSNGLFTYNHEGDYIHTIYESDGLSDNDLTRLYEDDALNIWVSSVYGVSVLEYGRAMREFLPSAHDLPEYSATLKNFNGSLYMGGNNGLYVWERGKFQQVYDDKSVYAFELTPQGLLIGSSKGLQLLDKQRRFHNLFSGGRVDLVLADRENPNVIYYSHDANALRKVVLQSENIFTDSKMVDFEEGGYTLTEDIKGDLWVGTGRNGDFHFTTEQKEDVIVSVAKVRQFTTDDGLPSNGFNYTMSVGKDVGFITSDGFYRLTPDRDSIVIDHRFDEVFYGQDRSVWPVVQDNDGGIWVAWAAAMIGKAVYNPEKAIFEWNDGEFTRTEPYKDIDFIYPATNKRIYFQTLTQKLAYFDSTLYKQPVPPINAHITSVIVNSDSLLLEPRGLSHSTLETPISFWDNKIRINYGMVAFLPEDRLFYQIKLEGLDDDWSATTNERYHDYTNLKEGKYTFWVRGHTLYPEESQMASFSFMVLPPWYRTLWAFALYVIFGVGGLIVFVKARENILLERQKELENEVLDRTEEIRNQKEKLEKLDKMKNTFFSNVSHEFRTPLTISSGLVDKLMKHKEQDSSNVQYDLSIVKRNMARLDDMVSQIIDLTKSDQNHLTLNRKYYKADNLVSISVESFRSLAEYHGHRFEFYPNAEDVTLYIDRAKVEIMINNLISNAIKFTPDGGNIFMETQVSENLFELRVQDSGSGIPDGEEEAIFERFHRLKRDDADYVEGMGVGLELSRVLARLHSGDIEVEKSYKQGACFKLLLPISETNVDEISPIPDSLDEELLYIRKDHVNNSADNSFDILLVEDNADMMEYVSGILDELGVIKKAGNGKEALEILEYFNPDIIVTDLMMPVMGGLELVEKLKNHEKWNTIPTMVLTAKALEKDKLHLMRIGVVDYITKPFVPEQLVLKLKNLLNYYTRRKLIRVKLKAEEIPKDTSLSEKTTSFISKNLANTNLSVDMLAEEFSQSRRSFYRNLQIETGMSPGEFIREVRITSARALVSANKNYRLEELATAVGYKSASSFRKVYEERFGVHPLS